MVSPVPVSGLARVGQVNPPARVKPFLRASSECAIYRVCAAMPQESESGERQSRFVPLAA